MSMRRLLLFLSLSGLFLSAFSQQDTIYPKKVYTTQNVSIPPEIDGWINDQAWKEVQWEGGFPDA